MALLFLDATYMECDLVSLTNMGEVQVFGVPNLRRQLKAECIKKDNIMYAFFRFLTCLLTGGDVLN